MRNVKQRLLLTKDDHEIIMSYIKRGVRTITFNRQDAEELEGEFKKAKLVEREKLPADVVRLNSTVVIRDEKENKIIELTVVTPEKADIRQKLISIMSPMGTALIGFRRGQQVKWKMPAGNKTFTIMEVQYRYI